MGGMRCRPSEYVDGADTKLAGTTCSVLPPGSCHRPPTEFILNTNNIKSKGLMIGNPFLFVAAPALLISDARGGARGRKLIALQATLIAFSSRLRRETSNSRARLRPSSRSSTQADLRLDGSSLLPCSCLLPCPFTSGIFSPLNAQVFFAPVCGEFAFSK